MMNLFRYFPATWAGDWSVDEKIKSRSALQEAHPSSLLSFKTGACQ
jgi:hypothetical protein